MDALRSEGFIVKVSQSNTGTLQDMFNMALTAIGNRKNLNRDIPEESIVLAYSYGKKIGWSEGNNDYKGYSIGRDNILWDRFGEFNKWSQAHTITKSSNIETIIETLKS